MRGRGQNVFLGGAVGYFLDPVVVRNSRCLGIPALRGNYESTLLNPPADRDAVYQLARYHYV